jgi:hypothetical protein
MARPKRFELLTPRFVVQKYSFAKLFECTLNYYDIQNTLYFWAFLAYIRSLSGTDLRTPRSANTV